MSFLTVNINKNHIFFPLLFISYFFRKLVQKMYQNLYKGKVYKFGNTQRAKLTWLDILILSPAYLFAIFCVCIEKIRAKSNNKSIKIKSSTKDVALIYKKKQLVKFSKLFTLILLVSIFNLIPRVVIFLLFFLVNDDREFSSISTTSSVSIFYIIGTSLLSRIFLGNYYYRHHFVSLAINIFSLILNIIIDSKNLDKKYNIIFYVINVACNISYSLACISSKFALTYISPFSLELYLGLIQMVFLALLSIPLIFIERNGENIFANFFEIIDDYTIIILYILEMICIFGYSIFIWIIINKFTPNDYGLSMMVETMIDKIFEYVLNPDSFTDNLILSILQIFIFVLLIIGICIHNEIIIINKWGLNEYTKKYIAIRGDEDMINKDIGLDDSFDEIVNQEKDIKQELQEL